MANIKKHIHGVLGSFIFLGFGIGLLLLLGFTTPLPLPEEQGILLDFTAQNNGSSESLQENTENNNNSSKDLPSEKVLSENNADNTYIPGESITESDVNPNEHRLNNLMENAFNSNNSSNSDDATNNNNPGINSNNNGPDSGFGKLNGNRQLIKVDPESRDNMYGTVVLKITVNENGKVTDINLVSTNCDQCVKAATDAIKKWQYEPLAGSGYQIGIVTIEFKQR